MSTFPELFLWKLSTFDEKRWEWGAKRWGAFGQLLAHEEAKARRDFIADVSWALGRY